MLLKINSKTIITLDQKTIVITLGNAKTTIVVTITYLFLTNVLMIITI